MIVPQVASSAPAHPPDVSHLNIRSTRPRFEETVVLQAASALFVKPPATLANTGTSAHGAGNGLTVLAGIGHAAAVDQEAVNAILNR